MREAALKQMIDQHKPKDMKIDSFGQERKVDGEDFSDLIDF